MNSIYINRLVITAIAAVVVAMSAPSARADVLTDGTVTMPRSGKEIVSEPAPEAAALCRHLDHSIDYSTGCVSLCFPLCSYECGDISLPVSMSYRTGGIKADSDAGALGVGWELNCGGCVSRSVVGMPDDAPNVEFSASASDLEFLKKLHYNTADAMYDRYSFSAGGYSGSFIIVNNKAVQLTQTDVRIRITATGFDIITPDGTLYRYDIPETLHYKYVASAVSEATVIPDYTCVCLWRLSRIVSPSRTDSVTLSYGSIPELIKQSSQRTIAVSWESKGQTPRWSHPTNEHINSTAYHTYSSRHRIESISGRGGTVSFSYDAAARERCTGITVRNCLGRTVRQVSLSPGRTLSAYRITDSGSNLLDGADFTYFPAMGSDSGKDFFGYRNGGGDTNSVGYRPDSLSINNNPYESALDKLLRPSWKRQPRLEYTRSESLHTVSTVAGTVTEFEYEPNDGGRFLTYGHIAPGVRLKKETVKDRNTGNERTRTLTYSYPVPSVDFSSLTAEDFVSVSGNYGGTSAMPYAIYTTGATLAVSCRLQGAAIENACVYYGKVTETVTGKGLDSPTVTDYEYDTSQAVSVLMTAGHRPSSSDPIRFAGTLASSDWISKDNSDYTPYEIYGRLLTVNTVRGYYEEIIGDRAPLSCITHWRELPDGRRSRWRQIRYYNRLSKNKNIDMGRYSETMIRVAGNGSGNPNNVGSMERYDFRSAADFNHFKIKATSVKVYVDSVTDTEYDEYGTTHTVIRRMGYNNHALKWDTGGKVIGTITGPDGITSDQIQFTFMPAPGITGKRDADNSLPCTSVTGCGDEWVRTDYVYSSTSDTPQMRALDDAGSLSLPVETCHTTGCGFEYTGLAVSERYTYRTGAGRHDMLLSSDVIRSSSGSGWHTIDSVHVPSHDSYGNPRAVIRNGGTPVYYGWTHAGTCLSYVSAAGHKTSYTWIPLVGCTSVTSPSGFVTGYGYSGSRLTAVSAGGTKVNEYTYSVHGTGTSGANYVNARTIIDAAASAAVNTRTYYDGFGNPTGTVTADNSWASPIATLDVYDAAGRPTRSYTPRPASCPADVPSAQDPTGDPVPYSVITYSRSGDTRPLSATIPGQEYSGHPSGMRYLFNTARTGSSETALTCRRYRPASAAGSVTLAGYYPEGALSVVETTDGDGRRSLSFTDFRGRLILTRSLLDAGATVSDAKPDRWADTYCVYDDFGNLVFVVTPAAAPQMSATGAVWSTSDAASAPGAQCYSYTYDGAMRLSSRKAPGAAAVSYVYDATGALTLTQDGAQRSRGVCSFALADSLGRAALTGECVYSAALAAQVEARHAVAVRGTVAGSINGYAPNITLGAHEIHTSVYYDDYSFLSLGCFSRLSARLSAHPLPLHKAAPAGLPTGRWTAVLGPATFSSSSPSAGVGMQLADSAMIAQSGYLTSTSAAFCYDSRDRLTATVTADHLGGLRRDRTVYNNAGMPLSVHTDRWPLSSSEVAESHVYDYVYDGLGRLSTLRLTRGGSVHTLRSDTYDGAGRLARSGYGNGCGVSYTYRASGAMVSLTASAASGTSSYSQTLRYATVATDATDATPSYSGNVGSIDWQGADRVPRRYGFRYDGLGRLISASYSETGTRPASSPATGTPSYTASYTYGPDSRPLTVRRQGVRSVAFSGSTAVPAFGEVDNLTFIYTGPLLTKVSDTAADVVFAGATDFDDGADKDVEYTYDADGRLVSDANKGITSIRYNAIGLPAEVSFSDGSGITNRYGADGTLLQRISREPLRVAVPMTAAAVTVPTAETVHNHIGAMTYRKGALWRIDTPSGYISADGQAHHYIRDHQGNVRQVTDSDGNVEQDNHYYPYGMLMGESGDILATARNGRNPLKPSDANPYLYGSKEYLTTAGANLLDFTARTYDPSTLLFHTPDPLRDKYLPVNSYLYCGANPINFIDPTGMQLQLLGSEEDIKKAVDLYEKVSGGSLKLSIDENGTVSILSDNRSDMELNQYQSTGAAIIDKVINDEGIVTLNVVNNSESVVIGDASTATIDIGDMLALGDDCHVNAGTTIMHETYEQYEIQTKTITIELAHCHAIGIEKLMMNSNFNNNKLYDDNILFGNRHQFNIGFGISLMNINNIESMSDDICISTTVIFKRNNVSKVIDIKH